MEVRLGPDFISVRPELVLESAVPLKPDLQVPYSRAHMKPLPILVFLLLSLIPEQPPNSSPDPKPGAPTAFPRASPGRPPASPARRSRRIPTASSGPFPKLTFKNPLLITQRPGHRTSVRRRAGRQALLVPQRSQLRQGRPVPRPHHRIVRLGQAARFEGVDAVYGLAFHPQFAKNRFCYVCYVLDSKNGEQLPDGSRVSRFRVTDTDPPRIDPKSEKVLLTWLAGGHNGGDLHFGHDGFLYISTGDGANPNPPDRSTPARTSATCYRRSSASTWITRTKGKPYAVPPDNPFREDARCPAGDLGLRLPQSLAHELRPRHRRPVGRRRRLGAVGDGLPRPARRQLRLVDHGRPAAGPARRQARPDADPAPRPSTSRTPRRPRSPAATSTAANA